MAKHLANLLGACYKILELDDKKRVDSEKAAFNFCQKRISVTNLNDEILKEVHKFPYPIQKLIVGEAMAMSARIEKGKPPPNLEMPECHCIFFRRYLLPCKHMFHQHLFGCNPGELLTTNVWEGFQMAFMEAGLEVYESRELVEVPEPVQTLAEKDAEARRLQVNELMERVRDKYWIVENRGNTNATAAFITHLNMFLDPILDV
jgi:hypothetical protein